jgi:hypothetical protein
VATFPLSEKLTLARTLIRGPAYLGIFGQTRSYLEVVFGLLAYHKTSTQEITSTSLYLENSTAKCPTAKFPTTAWI